MNITASSNSSGTGTRAPGKRSAYSHSGCAHCKKLRQKCDEKKPSCTACLNQSQECVYNQCIVMWTPQKKRPRKSRMVGTNLKSASKSKTTSPGNTGVVQEASAKREPENNPDIRQTTYLPPAAAATDSSSNVYNTQLLSPTDYITTAQPPQSTFTSSSSATSLSYPEIKFESSEDEPLFTGQWDDGSSTSSSYSYHGVSPALTVDDLFNNNPDFKDKVQEYREVPVPQSHQVVIDEADDFLNVPVIDNPPSPISDSVFINQIPSWTEYSFDEWDRIMSAYRPSSFSTEQDLQRFLEFAFLRTKCAFAYPFSQDANNALWKGIMESKDRHDFLRYAMLTATCNLLELHCKCSDWQPYRRKYMDLCMESLILKVSSYRTNEEITALFATSMILCFDKAASSSDKWRVHLRGALDLLKAWTDNTVPSDLHIAARAWFASSDTLAWLSSPNGGVVGDEPTTIEFLDDSDWAFMTEGIVIDGFNTFRGYSQVLATHMAKASKMMIEKKHYGFYAGDQDLLYTTLSDVAILENQQFRLSNYVSDPKLVASMHASHIIHCKALQLFIRVRLFETYVSCPEVQTLTNSLLEYLQTYPLRQSLGITIHWAAFTTGRSCITIEQRTIIERLLVEMINVGLHWARNSLHRLLRYWEMYDNGQYDFDTNDLDSLAT